MLMTRRSPRRSAWASVGGRTRGPHEDEDDDEYKETLALLAKKVGEHRRLRAVS